MTSESRLQKLRGDLASCESLARQLDPLLTILRPICGGSPIIRCAFSKGSRLAPRGLFADQSIASLREGIPADPSSLDEILRQLDQYVIAGGVQPTSGRFLGYVPGGGLPSAALGDFLAAITNKYSGVYYASPGAAEVENSTIRWFREMLGFPQTAWGTLQSGGSLATLTAIVAAREMRPPTEWSSGVLYATSEAHLAIAKSVHIAGLGHVPRRTVAVDSEFRLSTTDLQRQIADDKARGLRPWMVFATAGTTNTGAIDPLLEISRIARANGLWFHVDAAYGGFFILCESKKEQLSPMREADSIVLDPHKGLFLPYGCGAVLVRDGSS